ncbi:MAG: outer membrane beta-barrel protein [Gammaproteobacteria bacterium]
MSVAFESTVARAVRAIILVAVCCCAGSISAAEAPKDADVPHRFYAGVSLGSLKFHDSYGGVKISDNSVGVGVFGGAYLKDHLSLELSYDSFAAIDLHDLAGSGVTRFDAESRRRTVALSVVREVSMRDIFEWRRDWRVFGMAGVYRSSIGRTITTLGAGESSSSDAINGALLGGGVLYKAGPVDLRGYWREFGVLNDKEGRDIGIAVQRRF